METPNLPAIRALRPALTSASSLSSQRLAHAANNGFPPSVRLRRLLKRSHAMREFVRASALKRRIDPSAVLQE